MSNEPIPCSSCGQFCGDQFDLTCTELRTKIEDTPTVNVPRDKLANMAFGRMEYKEFCDYLNELQSLLTQPATPNHFCHGDSLHETWKKEPAALRLRYAERLLEEVLDNPDTHYGDAIQAYFAEGRMSTARLIMPMTYYSKLRETMEDAAASGKPCQLIVGDIHVAVTYQGIKWLHTQLLDGKPPVPLAIEEFDEIVADALGGKP